MNGVIVNEQQLQIEVDKLKTEFAETKEIYREVCSTRIEDGLDPIEKFLAL